MFHVEHFFKPNSFLRTLLALPLLFPYVLRGTFFKPNIISENFFNITFVITHVSRET